MNFHFKILLTFAASLMLSSCGLHGEAKYPTGYDRPSTKGDIYAQPETIWKNGSPIDKVLNEHRMEKGQTGPKVNE